MDASIQAATLLAHWISFLLQAIPPKLAPTLLELLIGCMVCQDGHISSAILAIRYRRCWSTYYKAIEKGRFAWLALAKQWLALLLIDIPYQAIVFAIDDFILPRSSRKAPSAGIHYDHAKRPNRLRYLWGQSWVSLALIGRYRGRVAALPFLFRLMRKTGNTTKLDAAKLLMSLLLKWLPNGFPVTLLLDAWYMKAPLLVPLIDKAVTVIGQARRDTALYLQPPERTEKSRGRPRKYGQKITLQNIAQHCPLQAKAILAYGKKRRFHFYAIDAKARFLKGHLCKIVWCRFFTDRSKWSKWHLLISTNPT